MPDLSHLEGEFQEADEQKASNFDEVPDGKYQVQVVDAEVKNARTGALMLSWTLKIVSGRFANRMLWRNNMLESKSNLGWLKKDLKVCGIHLEKLNDLNSRCSELIGLCLEVQKKTGEKFSNVYINKMIDITPTDEVSKGNGHGEEQSSGAPADDSDIPF